MIVKCKIHKEEKEKLLHLKRVVDLLTSAKTIFFFFFFFFSFKFYVYMQPLRL